MRKSDLFRVIGDIDASFIEEARLYAPGKRGLRLWLPVAAAAACVCVIVGLSLFGPLKAKKADATMDGYLMSKLESSDASDESAPSDASDEACDTTVSGEGENLLEMMPVANPVAESSEAEAYALYQMSLPKGAEGVSWSTVDMGEGYEKRLAEADFVLNGVDYTYRALETGDAEDISGIYTQWTACNVLQVDGVEVEVLGASDGYSVISWYVSGVQRCVSAQADASQVVSTAAGIMNSLGYTMDVAPAGAENVRFVIIEMGEDWYYDMAETLFTLYGINYSFRTVGAVQPENITGVEKEWEHTAETELGWCAASLSWDEGGEGVAIWYDVAPGLLYGLYMDSGASEDALMGMAARLYTPAQGDVDGEY